MAGHAKKQQAGTSANSKNPINKTKSGLVNKYDKRARAGLNWSWFYLSRQSSGRTTGENKTRNWPKYFGLGAWGIVLNGVKENPVIVIAW